MFKRLIFYLCIFSQLIFPSYKELLQLAPDYEIQIASRKRKIGLSKGAWKFDAGCNLHFKTRQERRVHDMKEHGIAPFMCPNPKCAELFLQMGVFNDHLKHKCAKKIACINLAQESTPASIERNSKRLKLTPTKKDFSGGPIPFRNHPYYYWAVVMQQRLFAIEAEIDANYFNPGFDETEVSKVGRPKHFTAVAAQHAKDHAIFKERYVAPKILNLYGQMN